MVTETHTDKTLTIELRDAEAEVRLLWRGKSNSRDPGQFLMPLLKGALDRSGGKKPLVLDFSEVEYMNSSTFSPLVKMLDEATRGTHRVQIEYSLARKWQALSFTALRAFETNDGRISFRGK